MTTGYERTRASVGAGEFLEALRANSSGVVPLAIREQAGHILRHYPSNTEIGWIADASRHWQTVMPLLDPDAVPPEIRRGYRR